MKKIITKLALTAILFTGATSIMSPLSASADQVQNNVNHSAEKQLPVKQFNQKINQYMQLLSNSPKTDLIKALLKDGKPTSLVDLGSKISLHSENEAAKNNQEANNNAKFYLRVNRIFRGAVNHNFQCNDGSKLSTNLMDLWHNKNKNQDMDKVVMTGMGLGDSIDLGHHPYHN